MTEDHSNKPPADDKTEADRAPCTHPDQQAGQDTSIAERLAEDPTCQDAKLDVALDESMDASDPPAQTMPDGASDPAPSSGYDPEAESLRRNP